MPWQGVSIVDSRMAFVTEYLTGQASMTELAAAYGVSRPTGYYWVHAYERDGPGCLGGGSRRPHRMPRATPPAVVDEVRRVRDRHPHWGAAKLRAWLQRQAPDRTWPCRDTIHQLLARAGRVRQRRRRRGPLVPPPHLRVPTAPNMVWTVDFNGEFRTGMAASATRSRCATGTVGLSCGVPRCPRSAGSTRPRSWPARLRSMDCRSGFGVITGRRLGARPVSPACRGWRSGGSGSACGRSASRPVGRSKTAPTSSFIGC